MHLYRYTTKTMHYTRPSEVDRALPAMACLRIARLRIAARAWHFQMRRPAGRSTIINQVNYGMKIVSPAVRVYFGP